MVIAATVPAVRPRPLRAPTATMRAVRLPAFGAPLRAERVPRPVPRRGEVLVRVAAAGVCRLDVELAQCLVVDLPLPAVLGHEVAGWVEAVGPHVDGLAAGTAVIVHAGWGCGDCTACRAGEEQLCGLARWCGVGAAGGFADFLLVPHPRHLVPLGHLDPAGAAPLADAGLTAYRAVRRSLDVLVPGTAAVVLGTGSLAQMAMQVVKALSAVHVVAVDARPHRRSCARKAGADAFVDVLEPGAVAEALQHRPAAAVFDMRGREGSPSLAAAVVAPRGRVMVAGLGPGELAWPVLDVAAEARVTTTWSGSRADLAAVVALAQSGRIFMRTDPYPLGAAEAAMDAVRRGLVDGRAVLVP